MESVISPTSSLLALNCIFLCQVAHSLERAIICLTINHPTAPWTNCPWDDQKAHELEELEGWERKGPVLAYWGEGAKDLYSDSEYFNNPKGKL